MDKVTIFGLNIMNLTFSDAVDILKKFLKESHVHTIFTPNTEIVMAAKNDFELQNLINSGDLVTADGIGLIYGSKLRKKPLKERVTGYDMSMELINIADKEGYSIYLLGAAPGHAEKAKINLKNLYPNLNICGFHDGYFKGTQLGYTDSPEEQELIDEINVLSPDIIFVGMGFPKQEIWINKVGRNLNTKLLIGNGGVIDILAGEMSRAPDIYIKLGLEWLYRLLKNPSRIRRQLVLPKFLIDVLCDKNSVK